MHGFRDDLCHDCGHHLHRPKPGKCGWYDCPCPPVACGHEAEIARLREALRQIDALPVGHYRRNGFASPDPWLRQREVRSIVRAALEEDRPHAERCALVLDHTGPCMWGGGGRMDYWSPTSSGSGND